MQVSAPVTTNEVLSPPAASVDTAPNTLKSGSISIVGLIALSVGMTSPALGLYALWGPIQLTAGPVTPLVFLVAAFVALPTAISYGVLNRESPSAGAASTWLWKAVSPDVGFLVGLTMGTYFFVAIILQPILFGLFFAELVRFFGFGDFGIAAVVAGVLLGTIPTMWATYKGAEASSRSAVVLMIVEVGVVLALCATIFGVKAGQDGISLAPFNPASATGGLAGFWSACILGILGFCGFDIVSTAAEEAKAPRDAIPRALFWTIVASASFWILTSWIMTLSVPAADVKHYVESGLTPVHPVSQLYWGKWSILVTVTGMSAALAVYITSVMGSSRMLFALSRHGLLPKVFSRLHPTSRVPWNAMHLVYAFSLSCVVASLVVLGNAVEAFTWWSNVVVFFALLTFIAVNASNLLFRRLLTRGRYSVWRNLLVPVAGVLANSYVIYEAFFHSLWGQGFRSGRSVILFSIVVLAGLVAVVVLTRLFRPARLTGDAPMEAPQA